MNNNNHTFNMMNTTKKSKPMLIIEDDSDCENHSEDTLNMTDISSYVIEEIDLTKLSKIELLSKCKELKITKCASKNKSELI